jgi:hypothetical protein
MKKQTINSIARVTAAGLMSAGLSGFALADSASMTTTGPDSTNTITIDTTTSTTVTITNHVDVTNVNVQSAQSGDVAATDNTTVNGPIGSGNASNNNSTATSVNVDNGGLGSSVAPVVTGGSGNGGSTGTGAGNGGPAGGSGGSVLGASTGGFGSGSVSSLPSVGASVPVDVSALRALYHPQVASAPQVALTGHAHAISIAFLAIASLLSLLGAGISAVYSNRRSRRLV